MLTYKFTYDIQMDWFYKIIQGKFMYKNICKNRIVQQF